jgi:hypothetical protein
MAFDLLVLILSVVGLMRTGHGRGSGLWKLLFRDGIAYFTVAFVGNLIAAVSPPILLVAMITYANGCMQIFAILHLNAA